MEQAAICFFLPNLNGGGAERMTLSLLPGLQALGYRPYLVVAENTGDLRGAVPPGVEIICLHAAGPVAALFGLVRFLRDKQPDIIISSLARSNLIALWARMLARTNTRIVIREHGIVSELSRLLKGRSAANPFLYRLFARRANAIVAISKAVASDFARLSHLPGQMIEVIPNPVIGDDFDAACTVSLDHPFFASGAPPVFVGAGRFSPEKDFLTLLEAFAIVRRGRACRLMLMGDGPQRIVLQTRAAWLGLKDDVFFSGFLGNPYPAMFRAAAVVVPSLSEGFGNVLVEAMAAGTPVIATDCAGPRELLASVGLGALVPPRDPAAMAKTMVRVLDDPWPLEEGRLKARTFTVQASVDAYVRLIQRVCGT